MCEPKFNENFCLTIQKKEENVSCNKLSDFSNELIIKNSRKFPILNELRHLDRPPGKPNVQTSIPAKQIFCQSI